MRNFYDKLLEYKSSNKLSYEDLGSIINKNGDAMRMAVKRKSISDLEKERFEQLFVIEQTSENGNNEIREAEQQYKTHFSPYKIEEGNYKEVIELGLRTVANWDALRELDIIKNCIELDVLKAELHRKKEKEGIN